MDSLKDCTSWNASVSPPWTHMGCARGNTDADADASDSDTTSKKVLIMSKVQSFNNNKI